MKESDLIEEYVAYCDKYLPNIPYPHEPLLMTGKEKILRFIKEAKSISYQIYKEKKRIHKIHGRKLHYAIIKVDIDMHKGKIHYDINSKPISNMTKKELIRKYEKIKGYKNNHPEKCYLPKLKEELKKDRQFKFYLK
jgi:hypothetical protein